MKFIPLTQSKFAIVDDEDFEELHKYKWHTFCRSNIWYARRMTPYLNKARHLISMHRQILGLLYQDNRFVDHVNGDGLDNRKSNIRICSRLENSRNKKTYKNNICGFKGVHWASDRKKFRANMRVEGKLLSLGNFDSAEEAHKRYLEAASQYFGEFARI